MNNFYETLGVDREATQEQIKLAYRRLAKKYHPDVSTEADAKEKFQELSEAYEILSDEAKRREYDRTGSVSSRPPVESQAVQMIIGIYMTLLEEQNFQLSVDYDKSVWRIVTLNKGRQENAIADLKRKIPKIEQVLEKASGEQLVFSIRTKLNQYQGQLDMTEYQLLICESALEQMKNYNIEQINEIQNQNIDLSKPFTQW